MYRKRLFLAGAIFLALSAGFKANAADLTPQEKKAVRFYTQGEDKESKGDKRFLELYEKSAKRGYIPASIKVKTLTLKSLETKAAQIKGQLKIEEDPSQLHSGSAGNLQKVIKLKERLGVCQQSCRLFFLRSSLKLSYFFIPSWFVFSIGIQANAFRQ